MKTNFSALCLALCVGLYSGCSTTSSKDTHGNPSVATRKGALSRETAAARARKIAHVNYTLWFGLDESHEDFQGRAIIQFQLKEKSDLTLDFEADAKRSLQGLRINGKTIEDVATDSDRYDGSQIKLKSNELTVGANRVEVVYSQVYSQDGSGLHRFKDPEDGKVYLYTDLEPYDANKVFPCFDQPDLKASYEVTAEAPRDWVVVSNTPEREVTNVDGRSSWQFPPSPVFSTYIFALHAGPYHMWTSDAEGIPLRLFARPSLAKYVDAKEWFDITRKGLDFFSTQFGYPYPYAKYDQLIVPEFNAGAMENVAAVTFAERYVFRGPVSVDRRRSRGSVILHEMAHMWFGNLVTMRWWNGLWLNESFATFSASWALDELKLFPGVWESFFGGSKASAYTEDQWVTTHPIEVPIADTDQAFANFDAITYGKGASALKQLRAYLGEEDFREGLQRYFHDFALKNTTLADFMGKLAEASGRNLTGWQKSWLLTPQMNTLKAQWQCDAGKITEFKVLQTAPTAWPTLRTHRAEVALYKATPKGSVMKPYLVQEYLIENEQAVVPELAGQACPTFAFPNHRDLTYAKVELDPASLTVTLDHLAAFESPLTRLMLWQSLWEMVRDHRLSAQAFVNAVIKHAAKETQSTTLARVLRLAFQPWLTSPSALIYLPTPAARTNTLAQLETIAWQTLRSTKDADLRLTWFAAWLDFASAEKAGPHLQGLLNGKTKLPGVTIDQDRRWQIVQTIARLGLSNAQAIVESEAKRDPGETGAKEAITAEASLPDPALKSRWMDRMVWKELNGGTPYKKSVLRRAMRGFNLAGQEELTRSIADSYFKRVAELRTVTDEGYAESFADSMFPFLCDPNLLARLKTALETPKNYPAHVYRAMQVNAQEEATCIAARLVPSPEN